MKYCFPEPNTLGLTLFKLVYVVLICSEQDLPSYIWEESLPLFVKVYTECQHCQGGQHSELFIFLKCASSLSPVSTYWRSQSWYFAVLLNLGLCWTISGLNNKVVWGYFKKFVEAWNWKMNLFWYKFFFDVHVSFFFHDFSHEVFEDLSHERQKQLPRKWRGEKK